MFYPALAKEAITAAINAAWDQAIDLNLKILSNNPNDLESLNRLARAYVETGNLIEARDTYKNVIKIDPYNVIAQRNLKKFETLKVVKNLNTKKTISPTRLTTFIEEPGTTKIVQLMRIADPTTLFSLYCGQKVNMSLKARGILVSTEEGEYIGRLPDDLAYSLTFFIQNGNVYDSFIKLIGTNSISIFISEVKRSAQFLSQPSFPKASSGINKELDKQKDSVEDQDDENDLPKEDEEPQE